MAPIQHIAILGAGLSGIGAAQLAQQVGYTAFVSDKSPIKPHFQQALEDLGVEFESGQHDFDRILSSDLIIKSPGIPEKSELMQMIRKSGIPVIGELEFAFRHAGDCQIVGITGSNGKTTTTELVYHILKYAGLSVRMAGNVGHSFAGLVSEDLATGNLGASRIFVLEISSFQLDDIVDFHPQIALLLNITPDHLDRYEYQMSNYVASKFRIAMNLAPGDLFISNEDDSEIGHWLKAHPGAIGCAMEMVGKKDLKTAYVRIGDEMAYDLSGSKMKGPHNMFNAACSIRAALRLGVTPELIAEAIYCFTPPAHRMERIIEWEGVAYINDSKATNVDAVFYALQAMDRPTIWIVGGQDKGNDYGPLMLLVEKQVRAIVCMGLDNSKIKAAFAALGKPMVETRSAEEAVQEARRLAHAGDIVLLSPACASFDLFNNYEHRGEMFRQAVLALQSPTNPD
ncbi:MAG: UDP-N-acetylmuramoyl-L-alanine--D-glutamate ligase [Lewinellaceae bacterium]|nr:UDP-N-acetylmuramoyl-L-alanine--D-glutamate ligase [Lewinellaceae bacterium]